MWVHFYGKEASCFYDSFLKQSCPFLFRPQNTIAFTDILHHLYQIHSTKPSLLELYANRYLTELITLCFSENLSESREPTSISEKIKQVHGYLDKYYAEKINLENLSSRFFISKFHLSREYKKIYGVTIGNELTSIRVSHAKSMLRFSDDSIENIALNCGFQEAGYFIKVFKITPFIHSFRD